MKMSSRLLVFTLLFFVCYGKTQCALIPVPGVFIEQCYRHDPYSPENNFRVLVKRPLLPPVPINEILGDDYPPPPPTMPSLTSVVSIFQRPSTVKKSLKKAQLPQESTPASVLANESNREIDLRLISKSLIQEERFARKKLCDDSRAAIKKITDAAFEEKRKLNEVSRKNKNHTNLHVGDALVRTIVVAPESTQQDHVALHESTSVVVQDPVPVVVVQKTSPVTGVYGGERKLTKVERRLAEQAATQEKKERIECVLKHAMALYRDDKLKDAESILVTTVPELDRNATVNNFIQYLNILIEEREHVNIFVHTNINSCHICSTFFATRITLLEKLVQILPDLYYYLGENLFSYGNLKDGIGNLLKASQCGDSISVINSSLKLVEIFTAGMPREENYKFAWKALQASGLDTHPLGCYYFVKFWKNGWPPCEQNEEKVFEYAEKGHRLGSDECTKIYSNMLVRRGDKYLGLLARKERIAQCGEYQPTARYVDMNNKALINSLVDIFDFCCDHGIYDDRPEEIEVAISYLGKALLLLDRYKGTANCNVFYNDMRCYVLYALGVLYSRRIDGDSRENITISCDLLSSKEVMLYGPAHTALGRIYEKAGKSVVEVLREYKFGALYGDVCGLENYMRLEPDIEKKKNFILPLEKKLFPVPLSEDSGKKDLVFFDIISHFKQKLFL